MSEQARMATNGRRPSAKKHIAILGAGLAGLSAGFHAKMGGYPFSIYEASERIGGIGATGSWNAFRYDYGAHRFHDVDPAITTQVERLLGKDLQPIDVPSQIYDDGKTLRFPFSLCDVLLTLGPRFALKAVLEIAHSRLLGEDGNGDFESFARKRYGPTLASRYLLNYSQKLWGFPCANLSSGTAGKRLNGLSPRAVAQRALTKKLKDLEGRFYYPKYGIGTIAERLAQWCGRDSIMTASPVSRILHDRSRIKGITTSGSAVIQVENVVTTIPITRFLEMMDPAPPDRILSAARRLLFRNLLLVAIFLDTGSVTKAATVYFPDPSFPFTRVYEPRNRSAYMAPPGKTSLVAELPCSHDDALWRSDDKALFTLVSTSLREIGWLSPSTVIGYQVHRLSHAYPIMTFGYERDAAAVRAYLRGYENLHLCGRNATFTYSWIHDMIRSGRETIEGLSLCGPRA